MNRDAENRKLAEWLGWKHFKEELGFECIYLTGARPGERVREVVPDFYTDEAQNAMVLEKMPEPALSFDPDSKRWGCTPHECGPDYIEFSWDADRKTAICNAALKLIEQQEWK